MKIETTTLFMTVCLPVRYDADLISEEQALDAADAAAKRAMRTALEGTVVQPDGRPAGLGKLRLAGKERTR